MKLTRLLSLYVILLLVGLTQSCDINSPTETGASLPTFVLQYDTLSVYGKVKCRVLINDSISIEGKIKQRGGSSVGFAKKSYTVKFKEKLDYFGESRSKTWMFIASYIDKSLMRNKLCYDMYDNFSEKNIAPDIKYIQVYHHEVYMGIYQFCEKIDQKSLRFSDKYDGGMIFKDCPVFLEPVINPQIEGNYYQQNYPSLKKHNYTGYMDSLKDFILYSSDQEFSKKVELIFDLDNIIDWQLMMMLSNNGDAVFKNFYLYKKSKSDKFKVVIWDYDSSLGRDADNELNMVKTTSHWERNTLLNRLYFSNINNYQERIKERWNYLRKQGKISVQDFDKKVDDNVKILRPYMLKNFEKWPVTDANYFDQYTFDQEIEVLKDFIRLRINQLDKKFE